MYFIIVDNQNTRWAYGPVNGGNPSLPDIVNYLKTSLHPEIFTIIFFDNTGIVKKQSIIEYTSEKEKDC